MTENYDKQLIILIELLKASNKDFKVSFDSNQLDKIFGDKISYSDLIEFLLIFGEAEILSFVRGGEDGFAEMFDISIKRELYLEYIQDIYTKQHSDFSLKNTQLQDQLKNIYGFLPESIVQEIKDSKLKLNEILVNIDSSEYLKPLKPKIEEINIYLDKTENVIKNYENIYLNIIKPIKKESKQGIVATTIWAILSIIITAILSFYFSYTTFNKSKISNDLKENTNLESDINISSLENKVNFLIRENTGLNNSFEINKKEIVIKYLDIKDVFISIKDTIRAEVYSLNDIKNGGSCYSAADLRFYINNRMITSNMLKEIFVLKTRVERENYDYNQLKVIEGDTLEFKNSSILIDKIYSKNSECTPIGDKIDAIRIIKII